MQPQVISRISWQSHNVSALRSRKRSSPVIPKKLARFGGNAMETSSLARLPTPEQIAAKVRRQPIGAVIADICRDLGIGPSHPLWGELRALIEQYDGDYERLLFDIRKQPVPRFEDFPPIASPADPPPSASTGPPFLITDRAAQSAAHCLRFQAARAAN